MPGRCLARRGRQAGGRRLYNAGGRRHYNAHRQFLALDRRRKLARMLRQKGGMTKRGYQARLARKLGVSTATICRDVRYLLQLGWPCPCCGAYARPSEWSD
jgi:hypothetical protein